MLNCITCSKALEEPICEIELNGWTTPRSGASKEAINNLTAKVKDLSLKLSGVYRQRRPFTTSTRVYLKGTPQRSLESDDETPEILNCYGSGFGSSTSTPSTSSASSSKPAPGTPMLESQGGRFNNIVFFEEVESMEWIVEAGTGVFITLLSIPKGKNHLKRVRFSKENFDKWKAQLWWIENYDKIVELYNVERTSREALYLITKSGDEEERCTGEATQHNPVMPPRCRRNMKCKRPQIEPMNLPFPQICQIQATQRRSGKRKRKCSGRRDI